MEINVKLTSEIVKKKSSVKFSSISYFPITFCAHFIKLIISPYYRLKSWKLDTYLINKLSLFMGAFKYYVTLYGREGGSAYLLLRFTRGERESSAVLRNAQIWNAEVFPHFNDWFCIFKHKFEWLKTFHMISKKEFFSAHFSGI